MKFETMRSTNQNLSFDTAISSFDKCGLELSADKYIQLELINVNGK